MNVLILVNLVQLLLNQRLCVGEVMTDLRSHCPFSIFCTKTPEKDFPAENRKITPCCSPCSCSQYCWKFGTCCPDAKLIQSSKAELAICQFGFLNFTFNPLDSSHAQDREINMQYRMINSCPNSYANKDIVSKCENSSQKMPYSFDDIAVVSDALEHDEIYKNKHCAACNEVTNMTRWNVAVARCTLPLLDENRTISEMFEFVLQNCLVISLPTTDLSLTPRSNCYSRPVISSCNETGLMETYDVQLENECNASYFPYFGPHSGSRLKLQIYRNVGCALCNKHADDEIQDICLLSQLNGRTGVFESFMAMIETDIITQNEVQERSRKCTEKQTYDSYMKVCRPFRCPIHETRYYGKCIPIFESITYLSVKFSVRLVPIGNDVWSSDILQIYDDILYNSLSSLSKLLVKSLHLNKCRQCDVYIAAFRNDTRYLPVLIITFELSTNKNCQLPRIIEAVDQFDINQNFTLETDSVSVDVKAYLDFSTYSHEERFYNARIFLDKSLVVCDAVDVTLTELSLCPHTTMKLNEYHAYIRTTRGRHETLLDTDSTAASRNLLPGFYAVNTKPMIVATCMKNMAYSSNIQNKASNNQFDLISKALFIIWSYICLY